MQDSTLYRLSGASLVAGGIATEQRARTAPQLLTREGGFNQGSVLAPFIVIAAVNMLGYVVLGVASLRAGVFPRGALVLLVVGAVLSNLPPGPVPMMVLATGGILWGVGALWLGIALTNFRPIPFLRESA